MMSKGKEGIAHAANQDGNRRHQHEREGANVNPDDVYGVVHDKSGHLGEEADASELVEIDFSKRLGNTDSVDFVSVHKWGVTG
jgi:hypothetical protein